MVPAEPQPDQPLPCLGHAPSGRRPASAPWSLGALATGLATRLKLKTSFTELLPSNDPGVVALAKTQKRIGDLSLLLIGIRSPDHEANLRYAEALTEKLRALPPTVVEPGDVPRARRARVLRAEQVALRLGGGPGVDPRSAAHRDQQAQEPAVRVARATTNRSSRCAQRMSGKSGLDERFPGGVFTSKGDGGDYVWIAALPPGGLFVENAGEALLNAAQRADRRGSADAATTRRCRSRSPGRSSPASPAATRSSATSCR